jgi:hypothetical protein
MFFVFSKWLQTGGTAEHGGAWRSMAELQTSELPKITTMTDKEYNPILQPGKS